MISLRLPEQLEQKLNYLAKKTHRSKTFYIKEALEKHLEDLEDVFVSLDRISTPNRKLYTSDEVLNILSENK